MTRKSFRLYQPISLLAPITEFLTCWPPAGEFGRTEDAAYEGMSTNRIAKGKDPAAEYDIDDHLAAMGGRVAPLASDF